MISYLLNSIICAGFCWICYVVLFQSEKMHQFNRYYLLVSLGLSILIPLIKVDLPILYPTEQNTLEIPYLISGQTTATASSDPSVKYTVFLIIYLLISSFIAIRLFKGLRQLYLQVKRARVIPINGMRLVLNNQQTASYSFFNYLFIAPGDLHVSIPSGKQIQIPGSPKFVDPIIWEHESAHARELHSMDILLLEILKIICWFNPFIYLFKHSIQLNHEFLADEKVIRAGQQVTQYQQLLLSKIKLRAPKQIVSSSVFSITKKRFIMMTQKTSKQKAGWLRISALPILGICFFAFSNRSTGQDVKKGKLVEVNVQNTNSGISQSQFDYYQKQLDKMRQTNGKDTIYSIQKIGGQKELEKLIKLYKQMSPAQKAKSSRIAPPPPPAAPKQPTQDPKSVPPPPPPPKVEKVNIETNVAQAKTGTKKFPEPKVERVSVAGKKQVRFSPPKIVKDDPTAKVVAPKKIFRFSVPKIVKDDPAEALAPKKVIRFSVPKIVKDKPTVESGGN